MTADRRPCPRSPARCWCSASRKSWLIALTPAGDGAFAEIRRRENAVSTPIAAALPAADVAICERVLAHMTSEFGRLVQSGAAGDEGDTT